MILHEEVISISNAITGSDPTMATIAVATIGLAAAALAQQHIKLQWYLRNIQALIAEFVIGYSALRFSMPFLPSLCGTIFVSNAIAIPINYLCCKWELDAVAHLCTASDPDVDYIAAFRKTNDIDPSRLTSKQFLLYKRDRIFTNIYLGNNAVAKEMLSDKALEPCFTHLALHVISESAGDYTESQLELEKANASKSNRTDPFITIQLELNQAVLHVNNGQFIAADSEFAKTFERAQSEKIKDISFVYLLFENWVFNTLRVSNSGEKADAGWKIVQKFENYLNDFGINDSVSIFNLKLQLMREIHSSPSEKNGMLQEAVNQTTNRDDLGKDEKSCNGEPWKNRLDGSTEPKTYISFLLG